MPEIIRDEKQTIALNEIEEMLLIVRNINTLTLGNKDYSVIDPGKGMKVRVDMEDADKAKVEAILLAYKNRLAKNIESKAKNFRIALSEDEKKTIETNAAETGQKKTPKEK